MESKNFQNSKFPKLTVDAIIKKNNSVVLIKRKNEPYKNFWALPGGFVEYNETVEHAVIREAREETGLDVKILKLTGVYSKAGRDPRGHTVSVVFLCSVAGGNLKADTDACDVSEFNINSLDDLKLAFDHERILKDVFISKKSN